MAQTELQSKGNTLLASLEEPMVGVWICLSFNSTVIFKQDQAKQISLALHWRHCWLIWLTDEYKMISNLFRTSKLRKHRPACCWMQGVIPGSLRFSTRLVGHEGHSTRCSAWASSRQWGRLEGLSSISRRTTECHCHGEYIPSLLPRAVKWKGPALEQACLCECVCVCAYVCGGSNLECAGGYGLFDVIDSLCSLQSQEGASQHPATCPAVYLPKSGGGLHPLGLPQPHSPLTVITITYGDINDQALSKWFSGLKDYCTTTDFSHMDFLPLSREHITCKRHLCGYANVCRALTDSSRIRFPRKNKVDSSELWDHSLLLRRKRELGGEKIQFQICGFRSGWKLNANKVLFLCVVIYHCAEQ